MVFWVFDRSRRRTFFLFVLFFVLLAGHKNLGQFFFPFPYREIIEEKAESTRIDPRLLAALIYVESRFNHLAVSKKGASGLMQLMPETGEWIAGQKGTPFTHEQLFEPEKNIDLGIWYLTYLYKVFDGETVLVLAAYNAGWPKVQEWVNSGRWRGDLSDLHNIPYLETRQYVTRIFRVYHLYHYLYS